MTSQDSVGKWNLIETHRSGLAKAGVTEPGEAKEHHRPGRRLWDRRLNLKAAFKTPPDARRRKIEAAFQAAFRDQSTEARALTRRAVGGATALPLASRGTGRGGDWCGDALLRRALRLPQDCWFDAALAEGQSLEARAHRFFSLGYATPRVPHASRRARGLWPISRADRLDRCAASSARLVQVCSERSDVRGHNHTNSADSDGVRRTAGTCSPSKAQHRGSAAAATRRSFRA